MNKSDGADISYSTYKAGKLELISLPFTITFSDSSMLIAHASVFELVTWLS